MKKYILKLSLIVLIALIAIGFCESGEMYDIKRPRHLPELMQDSIANAYETSSYDELYISAGIYSEYINIDIKIFEDGSGLLDDRIGSTPAIRELEKDKLNYPDRQYDNNFVEMIEALPEGEYANCYSFKLSKDDVFLILRDLGDGTVPFEDADFCSGHGVCFQIHLYLDGKAAVYMGFQYDPVQDDVYLGIKDWIENVLVPLAKDKGEIITPNEYYELEYNYLKEHSKGSSFIKTLEV